MTSSWQQFLVIALAHALAVASPGPDFAIVLRQSLAHGRHVALWTSLGIGCGITVHVVYSLLGLGYLLHNSPLAFSIVKYLGAAYLAFVGFQAIRAKPRSEDVELSGGGELPADAAAWRTGFMVNVLNPKAALFFIFLFSQQVNPHTPKLLQVFYGVWMAVTTTAWFCFVSVVFTREEVRRRFLRHGHWIDRVLGVVFLGFAVSLAVVTIR